MKRTIIPAVVVLLAAPSVARAELVRLTTGRVMSVESCRFDGESVVLSLELVAIPPAAAVLLPLDRFVSDLPRALAAYNAGEGAVARYGGVPPYPETQQYIRRVLALAGHH